MKVKPSEFSKSADRAHENLLGFFCHCSMGQFKLVFLQLWSDWAFYLFPRRLAAIVAIIIVAFVAVVAVDLK